MPVCNHVCEAGALRIPSTASGFIRSVYFAARARVNFLPRPLTAGHLHATPCVRVLPHCGISLAKLSFYGHIVECSKQDDSDSPFEIPSDDEPLMECVCV